jgi:hypothetical protein
MKQFLFYALLFMVACNNNSSSAEKQLTQNLSPEGKQVSAEPSASQDNGIVGKWRLTWQAYDENKDQKLDEEERKKGFANNFFYQFNADGSCLVQTFKGHYEIKEEGGKKKLSTYADIGGSEERIGFFTILSVNKDELLLVDPGPMFWIFKREK